MLIACVILIYFVLKHSYMFIFSCNLTLEVLDKDIFLIQHIS